MKNDKARIRHALGQMTQMLRGAGATDVFRQGDDTNHLYSTARMGFSAEDSVVDLNCRSWEVKNLVVCDGSVFPTNPHLTIQPLALRTADRIQALARQGEL